MPPASTACPSQTNPLIGMVPGVCAGGLDVLPDTVVVTLGNSVHQNGIRAELSAADAKAIGDFLTD